MVLPSSGNKSCMPLYEYCQTIRLNHPGPLAVRKLIITTKKPILYIGEADQVYKTYEKQKYRKYEVVIKRINCR
jgi:hypothetical protein